MRKILLHIRLKESLVTGTFSQTKALILPCVSLFHSLLSPPAAEIKKQRDFYQKLGMEVPGDIKGELCSMKHLDPQRNGTAQLALPEPRHTHLIISALYFPPLSITLFLDSAQPNQCEKVAVAVMHGRIPSQPDTEGFCKRVPRGSSQSRPNHLLNNLSDFL